MKFLNYLQEESIPDLIKLIRSKCKPFLKKLSGSAGFLYRGSWEKPINSSCVLKQVHKGDRQPRNMPKPVHKALDLVFQNKFGWKPRSEGVFCYGYNQMSDTYLYGYPNMCFPIGKFEFIWSPTINDLYLDVNRGELIRWQNLYIDVLLNDIEFNKVVDSFKNTNFLGALKSRSEIIIKCDSYFLVPERYAHDDYFKELLK